MICMLIFVIHSMTFWDRKLLQTDLTVIGYTNTYGGDYRWETEASGTAGRWNDNYYIMLMQI
ncbi:hypothetical protein DW083_18710 [Parabacteroides sp. AF48-14]|nr:hypothetical protein DW083_18710 [Parabacteroides sp. AF48-14]